MLQFGPKINLEGGKFKLGVQVTGTTGGVGTYYGVDPNGLYTAYTMNGVIYHDYEDYTKDPHLERAAFIEYEKDYKIN